MTWTHADEQQWALVKRRRSLLATEAATEGSGGDHTAELALCAADPVYWLDTYGRTYDPRLLPAEPFVPFHPYPRQVEFLRWLQEREERGEPGLAEKSRDVGFTWLCVAYAVHAFLFRPGAAIGFGSRKLELVDRIGDPNSIFEKARILLRHLPPWMLPKGGELGGWCKLRNPENGATITGEGGDHIGRGGRATVYFVDEAAFLEHPGLVEAALSQTTRVPIWVSTPNGPGNPFAAKRFGGNISVFTFHWKDDPRKGDEWYEEQKRRLDPVTVAQEIDIDYTASVEGICLPARWVRAAVELELPESAGPTVGGLDIAEEGKNRNVLIARRGARVRHVEDWSQLNTTQTAHRAADVAEKQGITVLNYDAGGVGAGVKGAFESTERKLSFAPSAILSGASPTETRWPSGRTSRELFLNFRAELFWGLRARFERAFEHVELGTPHPPEDMISIPNNPALIADLSSFLYQTMETGKIKIESKADMARRGVKSPDYADALALAFAPDTRRVLRFS